MRQAFSKWLAVLFIIAGLCAVSLQAAEALAAGVETESEPVITQTEKGLVNWSQNYVEATGMSIAPQNMRGAQAKALARQGAMLDLQRNLLGFLSGVQVDSQTVMNDFMASDAVRSEVHGIVKNVEVLEGTWDGESYTVKGRIKLGQIRRVIAPVHHAAKAEPEINIIEEDDGPEEEEAKIKKQVRKAKPKKARYTGLIIDVRHLPYKPAMTFNVYDQKGRLVYGIGHVNESNYLQSGFCAYFTNINYAKGDLLVASSPITAKAVKLGDGNVDIIISNSDAAKVRSSSYNFRKECKVIVVSR
ncbi:MAG: hypothetical protein II870_07880 [Synergistaceae bacterium]|nr:hypothetical protein [Synergistaceae bacterium]